MSEKLFWYKNLLGSDNFRELGLIAPRKITPWKINMEPENDDLEDDFPLQLGDFLVPAVHLPGCNP